jgi:hypothetical protein
MCRGDLFDACDVMASCAKCLLKATGRCVYACRRVYALMKTDINMYSSSYLVFFLLFFVLRTQRKQTACRSKPPPLATRCSTRTSVRPHGRGTPSYGGSLPRCVAPPSLCVVQPIERGTGPWSRIKQLQGVGCDAAEAAWLVTHREDLAGHD